VAGWLEFLRQLKFKGKRAAAFGCYGWSGESVKLLQAKLTEAGFAVAEAGIRSLWNPEEADFAQVPAMVEYLLAE
jgi:flavorubredoxin